MAVRWNEDQVYFQRPEAGESAILAALGGGATMEEALEGVEAEGAQVQEWFADWAGRGWLTR